MREALDWLSGKLEKLFIEELEKYKVDPWELRNEYIEVLLKRVPKRSEKFLQDQFGTLPAEEKTHVMRLLEMQRHELLMYTSCAWFFDELSGIETVQVLQYACRAIQLAESESNLNLQSEFLKRISKAQSNIRDYADGADVYTRFVIPSQLTLTQIGMHYAVASLYAENLDDIDIFNYSCTASHFKRKAQGTQRLAVGRTHVKSKVTLSEKHFSFIVLYFGQHHIVGKAFEEIPVDEYENFVEKVFDAFENSNLSEVLELFKLYPEQRNFSFFDMFKDEQIKLLDGIVDYGLQLAASSYKKINDRNYNLLNVMRTKHLDPPKMLVKNLEMVLNNELQSVFKSSNGKRIDIMALETTVDSIVRWNFRVESAELEFLCTQKLESLLVNLGELNNGNSKKAKALIRNVRSSLELLARVDVYPELNNIQDVVFNYVKKLPDNVTADTRSVLYNFCEYINLVVSQKENPKLKV